MLKTKKSDRSAAELKETKFRVGGNSVIGNNKIINQISSTKKKN